MTARLNGANSRPASAGSTPLSRWTCSTHRNIAGVVAPVSASAASTARREPGRAQRAGRHQRRRRAPLDRGEEREQRQPGGERPERGDGGEAVGLAAAEPEQDARRRRR